MDMASSAVRALVEGGARVLAPFYPERVSKIFVVNAPASFHMAWKLISPVCSKRTLDKVTIIGAHERERCAAELLAVCGADSLPAAFGGACTCVGEGGCWRQHPDERALWDAVEAVTPPAARVPPGAAVSGGGGLANGAGVSNGLGAAAGDAGRRFAASPAAASPGGGVPRPTDPARAGAAGSSPSPAALQRRRVDRERRPPGSADQLTTPPPAGGGIPRAPSSGSLPRGPY